MQSVAKHLCYNQSFYNEQLSSIKLNSIKFKHLIFAKTGAVAFKSYHQNAFYTVVILYMVTIISVISIVCKYLYLAV